MEINAMRIFLYVFKIPTLCIIIGLNSGMVFAQPNIVISPDTLYMGHIPENGTAIRHLDIYNVGTQNLVINKIEFVDSQNGSFEILNHPGTVSLRQLGLITIEIRFTPTHSGDFSTELIIESNANSSPNYLPVNGFGLNHPPIVFERVISEDGNSSLNALHSTSDGGYLLGGSVTLASDDASDMQLIKTDKYGNILWRRTYGGEENDNINKLIVEDDNHIIILGTSESFNNISKDYYLLKLDNNGDIIWEKTYGGTNDDIAASLVATDDGGYFLVGSSRSFGDGSSKIYLVKTDNVGAEQWSKLYGGSGGENARDIIRTNDGNFVIVGSTSSYGAGEFDIWVIKINQAGEEIWSRTFGGTGWDEGFAVAELSDGDLVITGFLITPGAGGRDMCLIRTDNAGNHKWTKTFPSPLQDVASHVVISETGIIIAGTTRIDLYRDDILVIKTDYDGNENWRSRFGSVLRESVGDMILNTDGHILLVGSSTSYSKNTDMMFINMTGDGAITSVNYRRTAEHPSIRLYPNYPNPFNSQTQISYYLPEKGYIELTVYDVTGRLIEYLVKTVQPRGQHSILFDATNYPSGIYFYILRATSGLYVDKMILVK
jgi:hypothetical protein